MRPPLEPWTSPEPVDWDRQRAVYRDGIAAARAALEAHQPPAPVAEVAPWRPAPPMPRRPKDAAA